jgi:hypothetical protein
VSAGSLEAIFGALTAEGRGFVLGATLLGLDEEAAARLIEPDSGRCGAALQTLGNLPREGKAARLGQLARELGAPYPQGLESVHASWIRKVLAAEPSDLLAALVAGAPPAAREAVAELVSVRARDAGSTENVVLVPEIATELRRFVFVSLVPALPDAGPAVAPLFELGTKELLFEIRRLGARSLGASLATAPVDIRARAMAGVGPALADDLRLASATADKATRHEGESDVKAASEGPGGSVEERLEAIGISALERLLRPESPEVRRALAVRLPSRLGRKLLPAGVIIGEGSG